VEQTDQGEIVELASLLVFECQPDRQKVVVGPLALQLAALVAAVVVVPVGLVVPVVTAAD